MVDRIPMRINHGIQEMGFIANKFTLEILDKKRPHTIIHFVERLRVAAE